jgi:nucleotide-binding universal stress UspA family protein
MTNRIEPGSIVVAVDGSDHAERAVRWAADQAALEGRPLVVISMARYDEVFTVGWAGMADAPLAGTRGLLEHANAVAAEQVAAAERLHPDLRVQALAATGDPRVALVDLSPQAHLIVLGSHGRGPLRSMLLGSVSAAVSKRAECPVVVCRPPGRGAATHGVVVAADGTRESLPVIEFAFEQASLRGLPLTVMHSFWDAAVAVAQYRAISAEDLDDPALQELRMGLSESVAGMREKYPDVPISLELRHGLVDEAVSPRGRNWDLTVVGRHPVDSIGRILTGSISTAVLERAHGPVAVVPEAPSE